MASETPVLPTPTPDELDDLIYFTRAGDLPSLTSTISDLCARHGIAPSTLLASAIDIDASGEGSQSTLLHFAAANNHLSILQYLLSLLSPPEAHQNGVSAIVSATVEDKSAASFVDHRNASGNTALHWGAMNGHLDVVKALVELGRADVGVLNKAGQDAVYVAEVSGKDSGVECAEWLLKNGLGLDTGVRGTGEAEGEAEEDVNSELEPQNGVEKRADGTSVDDRDEISEVTDGVERAQVADGG